MIDVKVPRGTVYLEPQLTIPMGIAAMATFNGGTGGDISAALGMVWLRYGIAGWDFTDEAGKPVPFPDRPIDPAIIERELPFFSGGLEVAEKANALYSDSLINPLQARLRPRSPNGQTVAGTSAAAVNGSTTPMPSRRSLPNGGAGKPSAVRAL